MRKKHFIYWLTSLATINFLAAQTVLADNGKILLELFTSQSCYSCPPADALLKSLDESQPDIVALEYHVDYWDDLQWGNAGNWEDPFSHTAFSERQRRYHQAGLSGRGGVYTPQLIINGATALVGRAESSVTLSQLPSIVNKARPAGNGKPFPRAATQYTVFGSWPSGSHYASTILRCIFCQGSNHCLQNAS
ncbi:MAG: DUF1223 domain-containing protein [Thiotrichales bacterium]